MSCKNVYTFFFGESVFFREKLICCKTFFTPATFAWSWSISLLLSLLWRAPVTKLVVRTFFFFKILKCYWVWSTCILYFSCSFNFIYIYIRKNICNVHLKHSAVLFMESCLFPAWEKNGAFPKRNFCIWLKIVVASPKRLHSRFSLFRI